jgi:thiamine biosynthesis lipoprotein
MNRRSFLKSTALLPLIRFPLAFPSERRFAFEHVLGTSLDLEVRAPDSGTAEGACRTVLQEVDRLASILDTRNPSSEISRLEKSDDKSGVSPELAELLNTYDYWERRTGGVLAIRPLGPGTPRNIDALGKAYILERAARAVRKAHPSVDGLLLNIGGDMVAWGRSQTIAIADPDSWYDNARPIAAIELDNAAIATSGAYARGSHLIDARTGQPTRAAVAATVVAPDAVTANALATTLCVSQANYGLPIVESTPGAAALRIAAGVAQRTAGFALLEQTLTCHPQPGNDWPEGYQLIVTLPLTAGRSKKRPYVAVWIEDMDGALVKVLAFWGNNSKYNPNLSAAWTLLMKNRIPIKSVSRATRSAGKYELLWDGLDNNLKPAPPGSYRVLVETHQEHGTYAKQAGVITLGSDPTSMTLPATTNFNPVLVQYGPRAGR